MTLLLSPHNRFQYQLSFTNEETEAQGVEMLRSHWEVVRSGWGLAFRPTLHSGLGEGKRGPLLRGDSCKRSLWRVTGAWRAGCVLSGKSPPQVK